MTHTRTLVLLLAAGLASAGALANEPKPAAAKPAAKAEKAEKKAPAAAEKGRDWNAIDTNKDGLISPDEMETWLKANPGPQK